MIMAMVIAFVLGVAFYRLLIWLDGDHNCPNCGHYCHGKSAFCNPPLCRHGVDWRAIYPCQACERGEP